MTIWFAPNAYKASGHETKPMSSRKPHPRNEHAQILRAPHCGAPIISRTLSPRVHIHVTWGHHDSSASHAPLEISLSHAGCGRDRTKTRLCIEHENRSAALALIVGVGSMLNKSRVLAASSAVPESGFNASAERKQPRFRTSAQTGFDLFRNTINIDIYICISTHLYKYTYTYAYSISMNIFKRLS
jgi:hypothetical protein